MKRIERNKVIKELDEKRATLTYIRNATALHKRELETLTRMEHELEVDIAYDERFLRRHEGE